MSDMTGLVDTFLAIYGLVWAACGVVTLVTGKIYGHGKAINEKNTEESLREAAPFLGIGTFLTGLVMAVPKVSVWVSALSFLTPYAWWILIGGVAVSGTFIALGYRKLVEK